MAQWLYSILTIFGQARCYSGSSASHEKDGKGDNIQRATLIDRYKALLHDGSISELI